VAPSAQREWRAGCLGQQQAEPQLKTAVLCDKGAAKAPQAAPWPSSHPYPFPHTYSPHLMGYQAGVTCIVLHCPHCRGEQVHNQVHQDIKLSEANTSGCNLTVDAAGLNTAMFEIANHTGEEPSVVLLQLLEVRCEPRSTHQPSLVAFASLHRCCACS
jgi:hypothetical protein